VKRHNVSDLRQRLVESRITRDNILCLMESATPPEPYVVGFWKGYSINLPDGVELRTKAGMKMMGKGLPVKVYNKDGQYIAIKEQGGEEYPIDLTYVINESVERVTDITVFD